MWLNWPLYINSRKFTATGTRIAQSVQWLGYRKNDWEIVVRFVTGTRDVCVCMYMYIYIYIYIYTFSKPSSPAMRTTKPPIQWIPRALFPVIECVGHKADLSLLSNVEVKNAWSYTSTPPYAFIVFIGTILSLLLKALLQQPHPWTTHSNTG